MLYFWDKGIIIPEIILISELVSQEIEILNLELIIFQKMIQHSYTENAKVRDHWTLI